MSKGEAKITRQVASAAQLPAERFDLLEVEKVAKAMVQQARSQVKELACKYAQLEEEYRKRREELLKEHRKKKEQLNGELRSLRERAEAELGALREEVKRSAKEEGFEEGFQEGLLRGREEGRAEGLGEGKEEARRQVASELTQVLAALRRCVGELQGRTSALLRDAERDVLSLAVAVAQKVVKREVRECPEAVLNNVKKALELIGKRSGATVEVNPDDLGLLEAHAPEVLDLFREGSSIRCVGNEHVERGGCVVRSGSSGVDLQISTQLELIEQALLGRDGEAKEESDRAVSTRTHTY